MVKWKRGTGSGVGEAMGGDWRESWGEGSATGGRGKAMSGRCTRGCGAEVRGGAAPDPQARSTAITTNFPQQPPVTD